MNNLVVFLLFSAFMLTLVWVALIPEILIPNDYSNIFYSHNRNSPKSENISRQEPAPPDYAVEKTTDIACAVDSDCITPEEYLIQSRCPFSSKCLAGKCAVVCPDF